MFQNKLLFNLVEDLFKWTFCLMRKITAQVQSERERIFDQSGILKKVLDTLSIFALKNSLYSASTQIVFQPGRGFVQLNWGSREECHCPSTVWKRTSFWTRLYAEKALDMLTNFALKNSLYSVSTQIVLQPSRGFIQMNWGSREECHCPSTVWERTNF